MQGEILEVNGIKYQINVVYEQRNNSRVSIGRNAINIRIPSCLNREEMFRELMSLKDWALKTLQANPSSYFNSTHHTL